MYRDFRLRFFPKSAYASLTSTTVIYILVKSWHFFIRRKRKATVDRFDGVPIVSKSTTSIKSNFLYFTEKNDKFKKILFCLQSRLFFDISKFQVSLLNLIENNLRLHDTLIHNDKHQHRMYLLYTSKTKKDYTIYVIKVLALSYLQDSLRKVSNENATYISTNKANI